MVMCGGACISVAYKHVKRGALGVADGRWAGSPGTGGTLVKASYKL